MGLLEYLSLKIELFDRLRVFDHQQSSLFKPVECDSECESDHESEQRNDRRNDVAFLRIVARILPRPTLHSGIKRMAEQCRQEHRCKQQDSPDRGRKEV